MRRTASVLLFVLCVWGDAAAQQSTSPAASQSSEEQLAERQIKLAEIRAQRNKAQEELVAAEARLRELEGPSRPALPDLRRSYFMALATAVRQQWTRPDNLPRLVNCPIRIRQNPGGAVTLAEVLPQCPFDDLGKRSVEAAVVKASPLPYDGFETVFMPEIVLRFQASD